MILLRVVDVLVFDWASTHDKDEQRGVFAGDARDSSDVTNGILKVVKGRKGNEHPFWIVPSLFRTMLFINDGQYLFRYKA